MAAPALDAVATTTTGARFGSVLDADDPAAVKAAVRSGVYEACKGQLYEEVQRLRPLIASGSDADLAAALRRTSLALADAAAAVAEADAALRLRGLADDPDLMPHWRDRLNDNIHRVGLVLAAMQRYPPERGRMQGQLLLAGLHVLGECASYWRHWDRVRPAGRNRPASASGAVDGLASGIQAVQISSSSSSSPE
ncbi:hypothetical protein ACQJBY_063203 [Aegilops geniculata]